MKLSSKEAEALGIAPAVPRSSRTRQPDPKPTQALFLALCESWRLPRPEPEYQFAPPRKWRFDWCWFSHHLALEIQGGLFTGGRHVRGAALLAEHEKLCNAAIAGYRVLFCIPADIQSGTIFPLLKRALS
jgi:hypothetical protein